MKLAFLGTSAFAVPALAALVEAGHDVVAVYTRAPKPGRPRPAGAQARRCTSWPMTLGLAGAHAQDASRAKRKRQAFKALDLDARGGRRPTAISCPGASSTRRCWAASTSTARCCRAGAARAPIHRAILAGDAETGVTTMRMDEGLDTGPMLLAERTPISRRRHGRERA